MKDAQAITCYKFKRAVSSFCNGNLLILQPYNLIMKWVEMPARNL